jgi:hypothetical protein
VLLLPPLPPVAPPVPADPDVVVLPLDALVEDPRPPAPVPFVVEDPVPVVTDAVVVAAGPDVVEVVVRGAPRSSPSDEHAHTARQRATYALRSGKCKSEPPCLR